MSTFVVSGRKVTIETEEMEIDAKTKEEAVEAFRLKYPHLNVEFVETEEESWDIIGQDEGTGEIIYDGDDYFEDEEGCLTLAKNMPKDGEV